MNQWISDRSFGTGIALAFSGDNEFVTRSINFAINFLLTDGQKIKEQTQTFAVVNTTEEQLRLALFREAYAQKILELSRNRPSKQIDWDALPEDLENHPELIPSLVDDHTDEMKDEASTYARQRMEEQIEALVYEAFTNTKTAPDLSFGYALGSDEHGEISA